MFPTRRLVGVSLMVCLAAVRGLTAIPADARVPRFGHVFLIIGENTSYEQITPAHAPFLTGIVKPQGAWLTNDHSFVKSSSLGQYVAMLSERPLANRVLRCIPASEVSSRCRPASRGCRAASTSCGH